MTSSRYKRLVPANTEASSGPRGIPAVVAAPTPTARDPAACAAASRFKGLARRRLTSPTAICALASRAAARAARFAVRANATAARHGASAATSN